MVHGNGPQVGALAMAQEAVAREVPVQPLFVLGAMTQGQLGYLLSQAIGDALASAGRPRTVAAVMTQVVVREDDPAFSARRSRSAPSSPRAGPAAWPPRAAGRWPRTPAAAGAGWSRRRSRSRWSSRPRSGACSRPARSWSPAAAGVPVARVGEELVGVDAVIDKDFAAALIGRLVGATSLLLLTGVDRVALDFGTPEERPIEEMTVAEARRHLAGGQFPPGSMGPKVEAAAQFIEAGGREAVISSLERAADALAGRTGTRIVA